MKHTVILFVVLALMLNGCSSGKKGPKPIQLSSVRPAGYQNKSVALSVPRTELVNAVSRTNSMRKLRLVKIAKSTDGQADLLPEYRMFGILPDSPYHLLGLQNADILVAANDYVIYTPERFMAYVALLAKEKEGFIEIRRDAEPLVMRYTFTD